jgi:hypothetical protein
MMDARPHVWGTWDDGNCTLRMEGVSFRGTLTCLDDDISPFSTWTLAFGGLNVTFLAHDITLGGLGLHGDGSRDGLV